MKDTPHRIPTLDGLRALSILIVVISHIVYSRFHIDKHYLTGKLGVRIFFAISGFLITTILISEYEKSSSINLKTFFFRRVFRIFPAYLFFLGFMMTFSIFGNIQLSDFISPLTYTSNYLFASVPLQIQHTWSLAVEEQFYLIFPVVLACAGLVKYKKFLLLILLITPLFRVVTYLFSYDADKYLNISWNFHTNMDVLATGCLLALYRSELHSNERYGKMLGSKACFGFALFTIFFSGYFSDDYLTIFYLLGISLMNSSIVFCIDWLIVNRESLAGKFLNLRPLKFIGVLSYSIYLWQQIFTFYNEQMPWTYLPVNVLLLAGFSLFSYYFVEKNFLLLRQKLEKKLFTGKPAKTILEPSVN